MGKVSYLMTPDGFWHSETQTAKKKWAGQGNWKDWKKWEDDGSWACHTCDTYQKGIPDDYEGNFGTDMYCRICSLHKSHSSHKLMSDRAQIIKGGTYLSRGEAKAERLKRKGVNGPKSSKIEG